MLTARLFSLPFLPILFFPTRSTHAIYSQSPQEKTHAENRSFDLRDFAGFFENSSRTDFAQGGFLSGAVDVRDRQARRRVQAIVRRHFQEERKNTD